MVKKMDSFENGKIAAMVRLFQIFELVYLAIRTVVNGKWYPFLKKLNLK